MSRIGGSSAAELSISSDAESIEADEVAEQDTLWLPD